jgi:hypothetical protein
MLARIVTGDELPEAKRASMQWKHPASPYNKKFKVTPSSRKAMLTVFWDQEDILLTHSSLKDKP